MSIDWSKTYKGAMRGSRGKFGSYAEMLSAANERQEEIKKSQEAFRKIEPLLKKSLMNHMVNRLPIRVTGQFEYFTESLAKSESGVPSNQGFQIVKAIIPIGTELTFSHIDKTMGQWIFKSQTGQEFEIYDSPSVQLPGGPAGSTVQINPGYYGLLTRTHIYQALVDAVGEENE